LRSLLYDCRLRCLPRDTRYTLPRCHTLLHVILMMVRCDCYVVRRCILMQLIVRYRDVVLLFTEGEYIRSCSGVLRLHTGVLYTFIRLFVCVTRACRYTLRCTLFRCLRLRCAITRLLRYLRLYGFYALFLGARCVAVPGGCYVRCNLRWVPIRLRMDYPTRSALEWLPRHMLRSRVWCRCRCRSICSRFTARYVAGTFVAPRSLRTLRSVALMIRLPIWVPYRALPVPARRDATVLPSLPHLIPLPFPTYPLPVPLLRCCVAGELPLEWVRAAFARVHTRCLGGTYVTLPLPTTLRAISVRCHRCCSLRFCCYRTLLHVTLLRYLPCLL